MVELKEIFVTKTEHKELSDLFMDKLAVVEKELTEELTKTREATTKLSANLDNLITDRDKQVKTHDRRTNRLIAIASIIVMLFSIIAGRLLSWFGIK